MSDTELHSMAPIIADLERLYGVLAREVGDDVWAVDEMDRERPIILVSSRGRKRVASWYTPAVWSDATDELLDLLAGSNRPQVRSAEIVLASEVLAESPLQIAAYLAREMLVHHAAFCGNGSKKDWRPTWGYYPEKWEGRAGQIGCVAEVDTERPKSGWSLFRPGPEFESHIGPHLNADVYSLNRDQAAPVTMGANRNYKYRCGCTTVRCATRLDATCGGCGIPFTWAESFDAPDRLNREDVAQ